MAQHARDEHGVDGASCGVAARGDGGAEFAGGGRGEHGLEELDFDGGADYV